MKKLNLYGDNYQYNDYEFLKALHDALNIAITGETIQFTTKSGTVTIKQFIDKIVITLSSVANGGSISIETPTGFIVRRIDVQCTVTAGSGTVTVYNGSTAITDQIDCATAKAINSASEIDPDEEEFDADDDDLGVKVESGGDPISGVITIYIQNTD